MKLPKDKGLCITCSDYNDCPMTNLLSKWNAIMAEYGCDVKDVRPDLWDEYSVDAPDIEDDGVMWCPLYFEVHTEIAHAAIIRSDGVTSIGKCHSDIIRTSPYGTCKDGSNDGFITDRGIFVGREDAFDIASEAGQLKPENLRPKNRKYLLSEDIWSSHDNGDFDYNEEDGYFKKER